MCMSAFCNLFIVFLFKHISTFLFLLPLLFFVHYAVFWDQPNQNCCPQICCRQIAFLIIALGQHSLGLLVSDDLDIFLSSLISAYKATFQMSEVHYTSTYSLHKEVLH